MKIEKTIFKVSLLFMLLAMAGCRESYLPPTVTTDYSLLVVDGVINAGGDSSFLKLSRTRKLSDTATNIPEPFASVLLESKTGVNYSFTNLGNGLYAAPPLPLSRTETYRLRISTSTGSLYQSDYVPVKITPAIDSLSWKQDTNVFVSLYTHDPLNDTRFYRWEFKEIWEYRSFYDSNLEFDYVTNQVLFIDSAKQFYRCWNSSNSFEVLLGTSSNLAQDVINDYLLQKIDNGSDKISTRYSIEAKQYALTRQAFDYWQLLKKNGKELGSLFGALPSELIGNIHCVTNPSEPVIGFVSISTVETKRNFITNNLLKDWNSGSTSTVLCAPKIVTPDSISYYLQTERDKGPAYFITGGGLAIAPNICIDCRIRGGNTKKPAFW